MRYGVVWVAGLLALVACGETEIAEEGRDCTEGERRCLERMAQRCVAGAWVEAEACPFTCSDGACVAACAEGERRCSERDVERCEGGIWVRETTCDLACVAGACTDRCTEGERRCWENVAQSCIAGTWENEEVCPFSCEAGSCVGACAEGERRCNGLDVEVCETGAWRKETTCDFLCEAGECGGSCAQGETRCWQDVVQRCDGEGQWHNEKSCLWVCIDGACGGVCSPGSMRCAGLQPQKCDGGFWKEMGDACEMGCIDGGCTGVCFEGERRCQGDSLQRCDSNGSWKTLEICPFLCAEGACAGSCEPGASRCYGNTVQFCSAEGSWIEGQSCAAGCDDGACLAVCTPGESRCAGDEVLRCDGTGQWRVVESCPLGCGTGACLECSVGETRCVASAVESCIAPGFWDGGVRCPSGACSEGACIDIDAPSCATPGPGRTDCGPGGNESCCESPLVEGGAFFQDNDPGLPALVSSFRLDKYEITVGRFRAFVAAMDAGWRPQAGDGRHLHLRGGAGLEQRGDTLTEPGWDPAWTVLLPADWNAAFASAWSCNWTDQPGPNEKKAMNCIHWEEAYAFCIWDGGFLPSEAEWNYAAAGGDEQRLYPWGAADPDSGDYAVHSGACAGGWCMAPDEVGTRPLGAARWGHQDMAANAGEWVLDWYVPYAGSDCEDCVDLFSSATMRVLRGGAHWDPPTEMISTEVRNYGTPDFRVIGAGARCARAP